MRKIFVLLFLVPIASLAQNRVEPGKLYEAGESLLAPRFGVVATVPAGWSGLLPRESEVFLLSSSTEAAEIFVFGREKSSLNELKAGWEKGIELDAAIKIKAKNASIKEEVLSSEAILVGPSTDKSKRGYAVARCGGFGPCLIVLAIMPASRYDDIRNVADGFMNAIKFTNPSSASPYVNFDWKKFLTGKMLTAYAIQGSGSKETKVDLCADGTFKAKATKRGIMKDVNPAYRGNLSGTWTAEGIGETGKLILEFSKKTIPSLEVTMSISDEKIFANGERYFAGISTRCK